jgi:hypothetical protein
MRALSLIGVLLACATEGPARGSAAGDLSDLQEAEPNAAVIVVAQRLGDRFLVQQVLKGTPVPARIVVVDWNIAVAVGDTALLLLNYVPERSGYVGVQVGWAARSFPIVGGEVVLGDRALAVSTLAAALGLRSGVADLGIDAGRTFAYLLLFGAVGVVGFELGRRRR